MSGKQTNYSELRNLLLVVSFNQPTGEHGQDIQPVVIEARTEAITDEGAVRNVTSKQELGALQDTPLTLKQIYNSINKATVGPILAGVLKSAVLEAIAVDTSV